MDEVFAAIAGETLKVYQDKYKLRSRILSEASQYIETDSSD